MKNEYLSECVAHSWPSGSKCPQCWPSKLNEIRSRWMDEPQLVDNYMDIIYLFSLVYKAQEMAEYYANGKFIDDYDGMSGEVMLGDYETKAKAFLEELNK